MPSVMLPHRHTHTMTPASTPHQDPQHPSITLQLLTSHNPSATSQQLLDIVTNASSSSSPISSDSSSYGGINDSKIVLLAGKCLLRRVSDGGDSVLKRIMADDSSRLDLYQHILEAALELNQIHDAQQILELLREQNPLKEKSVRFRLLQGMFFESLGDYDEAIEIYQGILKEKPLHKEALKRNISIAKALKAPDRAIKWLNKYLGYHGTDAEAHAELVDLYLDQNMFSYASVAAEQLILLEPDNWAYNIKYADVLCRNNEFSLARKYYSKSLNLRENNNLRAALGLLLCLDNDSSSSANDKKLKRYLHMYITELYGEKRSPLMDLMKDYLTELDAES